MRNLRPRQRRARFALAAVLCAALSALAAAPAGATFHLIKVSEVHPDNSLANSDYIELQMYADGQNFVGGHYLAVYNSGNYFSGPFLLPNDVANGQTQRTILIGNTGVQMAFGVVPDFSFSTFNVPTDGSVCWLASSSMMPSTDAGLDCVSFGLENFPNPPSPTGTPAPAIPTGKSLTRKISPGCPTFLEAIDDTDNSVTDFVVADPSPRNNSTVPTEQPCTNPGGDTTPPNTKLKKRPPNRTRDRTPTFRFVSTEPGSRFRCKLDAKKPRSCRSPFTTKRLGFGSHTLRVTAIDKSGNADRTPAKDTFRVVR